MEKSACLQQELQLQQVEEEIQEIQKKRHLSDEERQELLNKDQLVEKEIDNAQYEIEHREVTPE